MNKILVPTDFSDTALKAALYGDGVSSSGYLNNAELYAGNMEYIIATNSVPLTGGTLTLQTGTVNNYKMPLLAPMAGILTR
ncbi:hypothetical protein FAM09_16335 [Niastella caeni]|uniref:Uncharacterized protein n=1 Tax=Niastella caeni TaxID=2569763 RepID=A0A4S8HW15_9BACT|nr:hypothetical protein [Niastella caeni]THU38244.1 hypothetical protein FAM09_16335 [Niastella caeni]